MEYLYDVVELHKEGKIKTKIQHCTFDNILDAGQNLVDGTMEGRAFPRELRSIRGDGCDAIV